MTEIVTRLPVEQDAQPTVGALLNDPAVRTPVKVVLRNWAGRDPVDAAFDASLLAALLARVADERCGRASAPILRRDLSVWHGGEG